MQHLTPVGLSQDGTELILVSDTGEEYAVRVDYRFRTALRGDKNDPRNDPARHGQTEVKMESALRPRDIQSRIRGGESAEDVAAAAQTTVEAIMPFAAPVLAERAHVAQTAVKSSIRRTSTESAAAGRTLDESARHHLTTVSVRADDVEWDAWRREDGRWNLVGTYLVAGTPRRAEFSYDQPGRFVIADNDEARLLTGEATLPAPSASAAPLRRLNAVPNEADELPLGDDALEMVSDQRPAPTEETMPVLADLEVEPEPWAGSTTDLTEAAAAVREEHREQPTEQQVAFDDVAADHADADWIAGVTEDEVLSGHAPQEAVEEPVSDELPASDEDDELPIPDEDSAPEPAPRKKGRSSVPSWDEIMFGGGKHE
ncbi:MAG TPA: septation protein SepH [Marmoricola sp.]|nr:septation protein SepH [Marmoricola sp.]